MNTIFAKLTGPEFDAMVDRGAFDCIQGKKAELIRGELRFMNPSGPIHDDYIDYLNRNQLQADRQIVAIWRKLAYPFTLIVMLTIAAPISFMQTRRGGVGAKVFLGILL